MKALAVAMAQPDPGSLAAGELLRRDFSAADAAWALAQATLRRKAADKFPLAKEMLFTPAGLEQATRWPVALWRAARFADYGVRRVWDVGCGIGADAMAFAQSGIEVVAVDADPQVVEVASHNLALVGAAPAVFGRAEELNIPESDAVFLDPARRTARGRSWRVADLSPSWSLVSSYLTSNRFVGVKLGPGVPKEILPGDTQWCWVSESGDVVEVSLWNRFTGRCAIELSAASRRELVAADVVLPVKPAGAFLAEPNPAAIRAGLVAEAAGEAAWLLDEHVAYLSSDRPIATGWVTNFRILEVLPYERKVITGYLRDNGIGSLEIKKRAIDVDPAELRRRLKPKGPNAATIILARTPVGARAFVVERC